MWVKNCIIAPPFMDGWRFVLQYVPYNKGLLSTAEMERLSMYRRDKPACGS